MEMTFVGGKVTGLRLDDWQSRDGAAAELVIELRGALEQTGVQIEDIARVCLASRRTAEQQ